LKGYRHPSSIRDKALLICNRHTEAKFEALRMKIKSGEAAQSDIDTCPDHWLRILETQGLLRCNDGEYTIRMPAEKDQEAVNAIPEMSEL
jgi:hypothetical protein